jgi:hypothetical protein
MGWTELMLRVFGLMIEAMWFNLTEWWLDLLESAIASIT